MAHFVFRFVETASFMAALALIGKEHGANTAWAAGLLFLALRCGQHGDDVGSPQSSK